ncbi:glutamate racemase [Metallumcola ferriviriculae]|uniref:Glutamate racemase n=1 Tax=Metallumcola ferriviriculae TaxID=3039180 RepID=A0AAU0ULN5_9FIRM|nr:glutamate racemase [Desulfitibacteraceae bacterium MK1]
MNYRIPVGVFDSGVGGLTVAQEIFQQVPEATIIYFGDTAHVPYGPRSKEELIGFADKICQYLIEQGAQVIVDACNSTSAVALEFLKEKYHDVPIIGVIDPGVETALKRTRKKRVGVIATEATINSDAHKKAMGLVAPDVLVAGQSCPMFVPLVEGGQVDSPAALEAAEKYLAPLMALGIDTLILGCTHYPFLAPVLKKVLGDEVKLVDPARETVRRLKEIVAAISRQEKRSGEHQYVVSGDPEVFQQVGNRLMNDYRIPGVEKVELDWGD